MKFDSGRAGDKSSSSSPSPSEGCGAPESRNWNLQTDLSNSGADKRAGGSPLRLVDRLRNAKGKAEFTKLLPKATHFAIERSQSSLMISQVIAGRDDVGEGEGARAIYAGM